MSYKIAVSTSDGENVDQHFGSTEVFIIYEVDGESYHLLENRRVIDPSGDQTAGGKCGGGSKCGDGNGCNGGGDGGNACGGGEKSSAVELLSDCRAVVCAKIGRNILRQLELRAISTFDVSVPVKEALDKITAYFYKVDSRKFGR